MIQNMKKIICILAAAICLSGCIGKFEEYNRNPYQPTTVPVRDLLSSMFNVYASPQQNECQFNNCMWACYSGQITAPHNWGKGTATFAYFNAEEGWNQSTTNTFFTKIYSNYFIIKESTKEEGIIYAIAQLTRIFAMQEVASLQGPIPYTKVRAGDIYVEYDDEETVWKALFDDLDGVIRTLTDAGSGVNDDLNEIDQIYGGDCRRWLKFANTLKLRMAMRISGIAPELARTKAEEAVASGVLSGIDDSAYDTTNSGQTNNGYKIVDGWGELKANACLVSYMNGYADPRRAAYFTEADESLGGGYIGVRSGTNEPPVPADYNGYSSFRIARVANKGLKDAGANPMPIMYASEAWFLRAEGALRGWDMGGTAGELYEEGIRKSFEEFDVAGADEYMTDSAREPYGPEILHGQLHEPVYHHHSMERGRHIPDKAGADHYPEMDREPAQPSRGLVRFPQDRISEDFPSCQERIPGRLRTPETDEAPAFPRERIQWQQGQYRGSLRIPPGRTGQ